jgi:hypothetical protein
METQLGTKKPDKKAEWQQRALMTQNSILKSVEKEDVLVQVISKMIPSEHELPVEKVDVRKY